MIRAAAIALVCVFGVGPAAAGGVLDRYAKSDCVIAPGANRPVQAQQALANGRAVMQGDWLVLGPEVCTMLPPDITPELSINDPEVAEAVRPINRAHEPYNQGCFVDPVAVQTSLQRNRGWSVDRAYLAYFEMVAAGIISGEWRFFGDSPLRTPVSVQYLGGACADVPYAPDLAQSHADFIRTYDAFVRANAPHIACAEGESLMSHRWAEAYQSLGEALPANAWHPFEFFVCIKD